MVSNMSVEQITERQLGSGAFLRLEHGLVVCEQMPYLWDGHSVVRGLHSRYTRFDPETQLTETIEKYNVEGVYDHRVDGEDTLLLVLTDPKFGESVMNWIEQSLRNTYADRALNEFRLTGKPDRWLVF